MSNGSAASKLFRISQWLVFLAVILVYAGPFWWPGNGNGWVALVRFNVFLSVLLIGCLVVFCRYRVKGLSKQPLALALMFLFSYLFLNATILNVDEKVYRRLLLLISSIFVVGFCEWRDEQVRRFAILTAVIGSSFALFSLVNKFFQHELPRGYRIGGVFDSGVVGVADFGNTIVAAMHYAITFVFLSYLFFTERQKLLSIVWFSMLGVVSLYVALTFARSGWIACMFGGLVIYLQTFSRDSVRHYLILLLGLFVSGYFANNFLEYELFGRGLTYRDEIWKEVLERMRGVWGLGHGVMVGFGPIVTSGGQVVHNSHNVYLEILYQTGGVGLGLYILLMGAVFKVLIEARKSIFFSQGAMLSLSMISSVSIVMLTELNSWIHSPNLLWQWLWLPIGYALSVSLRSGQDFTR